MILQKPSQSSDSRSTVADILVSEAEGKREREGALTVCLDVEVEPVPEADLLLQT